MMLPILRLVLIYFLLVAAVVAVFNRDKLAPLLPGRDRAETAAAPDAPPAPPAAVSEDDAGPAADHDGAGGADESTPPVFPDAAQLETTAEADGATPGADAEPVITPAPGIAPEPAPLQPAAPQGTQTTAPGDHAAPVFPRAPGAGAETAAETQRETGPDDAQQAGAGVGVEAGAETGAAPQPAKPGSPAPLGTPVAASPESDTDPAVEAAPQAPETAPADGAEAGRAELQAPEPTPPAAAPAAAPAERPAAAAAPTAAAPGGLGESLAQVRAAYWSGDITGARAKMDALAAAHPDNPDVAGELGNLAFALRDYPAAADAWYTAGLLLIERGESARVMSFQPFLQSIAPDKAAELAARMQER